MTPAPFILCVDRLDAPKGRVWAIRTKGRWQTAPLVHIFVSVTTVFKGTDARQPKAYLTGYGVVRKRQNALIVTYD